MKPILSNLLLPIAWTERFDTPMTTHDQLLSLFSLIDDALDSIDRSEARIDRLLVRALRQVSSPQEAERLKNFLPEGHPYIPLFQALHDDLSGNPPQTTDFPRSN